MNSRSLIFLIVFNFLIFPIFSQNLLENPGFENGHDGWDGYGEVSTANSHEGTKSLHFGNGTAGQVIYDLDISLTYKVSCWIYISEDFSGEDWGGINLSVKTYNWQDITQIAAITPNNHPVGKWFQIIATFLTPSENIRVSAGMFGGSGWNPDFYIDDVRLFVKPVQNTAPVISEIILNSTFGPAPFTLSGKVISTDGFFGAVVQTLISTGDGGTIDDDEFGYIYTVPGEYLLNVLVTDDDGAMVSQTRNIVVTGNSAHFIQIQEPTNENTFTTVQSEFSISGIMQGGTGPVFWINTRNNMNAFVEGNQQFSVSVIPLEPGNNIIQVQCCAADSTCRLDELLVIYEPQSYTGPQISNFTSNSNEVGQYEKWECKFEISTVADNPWFPYDTAMPANTNSGSGISVDAVFTKDTITRKVPAFYDMDFEISSNSLRATGVLNWKARMAFDKTGTWNMKLVAGDAGGISEFEGPEIQVTENTQNPGFVKVSQTDNRYFEYDNGKTFVGMGHGFGISDDLELTDANFEKFTNNGINFSRIWLMGDSPFSDAWCSWATHHEMTNNGYMPPPLYSINQHYKNGDYSWRLAAPAIPGQNTPAMFRGFWDSPTIIKPSTNYRIVARVKTINLSGNGGLVMKTGGWLGQEAVNPGVGEVISGFLKGNNNWVYLVGNYTSDEWETRLPNIYLVLQNNISGEVYVDQMTVQEVFADGSLSANILAKASANVHYYLDPIESRYFDYAIEKAAEKNVYFKIPILEKNDWILNHIEPLTGMVTENNGEFAPPKGSKLHRLYEYYWRYLIARWGYATSIHSWELVNEGAPGSYTSLMDDMADYFDNNSPYPRMTSTSFWATWQPEYWANSKADYSDVHAYVMTTGWLDEYEIDGQVYSREQLRDDAAAAVYAYSDFVFNDPTRNKPMIHAEMDLDQPGDQSPDPLLALDTAGIWLHNFNWGHINHGGSTAFIWNKSNIINNNLYYRYKSYMAFMQDIPLNNGQYIPLNRSISNPQIRVWGQQQTSGNAAHCWVQNKNHTCKNVVLNGDPDPESGEIVINGIKPGEVTVEIWDSWNEVIVPSQIQTKTVGQDGKLTLQIENLVADVAFKIWSKQNPQVQTIELNQGWAGVSAFLEPTYKNLEVVLNEIMPDLKILSNFTGIFWPDGQVFTLDQWDSHSGYFIKLNAANQLIISGLAIQNRTMLLPAGWSILPVLSECPVWTEDLFGSEITKLEIVKEIAGNKLFWPENQVFTLTQLLPGKAYLVKTNDAAEITFPVCKNLKE
jgi:hypothetical protein